MATIDSYYFQVCLKGAVRQGLDAEELYLRAGVNSQHIQRAGARESVEAMAALVRDIWQQLDDEFMGYTATPVRSGAFALMVDYAASAATVEQALERGLAFYRLVSRDITSEWSEQGEFKVLTVSLAQPELDPDHYFLEFWLIIWHRLACWLAGQTIPLVRAEFSYARPLSYFDEFRRLFPCELGFERPHCRLYFSRQDLRRPIKRDSAEVQVMIHKAPLDLMTIPASESSLTRQVYLQLRETTGGIYTARGLREVASDLGVAPDMLRRGLRAEGSSFRQIGEDIRREIACSRLRDSRDAIDVIAEGVGYQETRSFSRAFKEWTGMSPSAFRRREQAGR